MEAAILSIYKRQHRSIRQLYPEDTTPQTIRESAALNTHYYAVITTDEYKEGAYVDLSTMMQEQQIGQTLTWEDFFSQLTPALIDSYKLANMGSGGIKTKQVKVIHPLTTLGIDLGYCDKKDTSEVNLSYKRWDLPDLVISLNDKYYEDLSNINLKNCIVSVNGNVCFSAFFENKLYVDEGSRNLWNISKNTTPDITMLDVSELGDLEAVPLRKCTLTYNGKGEELYDKMIKIQLPKGYSFEEYTPILCIAGKCMFADELSIPNSNTIYMHPNRMNLQQRLLALYDNRADYINHTEIVHTVDTTILQYLSQMGKTERSDIYDVLYLVKTPKMNITRNYITKDILWLTKFDNNAPGLIVRLADKAWMDYTTIEYDQYYLRHGVVHPTDIMRMTVEDNINQQYGVRQIRCKHLDEHFRWMKDSLYQMVQITG